MQAKYIVLVSINFLFLFLLAFSWLSLTNVFSQTSYQTIHLTRIDYYLFTIRVQDWNYTNGTIVPTSGFTTHINYPSALLYVSFFVNTIFIIGEWKEARKRRIDYAKEK